MLAMVLAVAVPALAQQGGDQTSVNTAEAVNDCDQSFEQNQVAIQANDIDQDVDQDIDQYQANVAILSGDVSASDDSAVIVAQQGNQSATQYGAVAIPVQNVEQSGAAAQGCEANALAVTLQYQQNIFEYFAFFH